MRFSRIKPGTETIVFLIIFLTAIPYYLLNINLSDIWIDESFTKALMGHNFSEILIIVKNDFHPPLYFITLKLFTLIFGISDFTIRFFSVLGILSLLVLNYTTGQKVFGKKGSLYFTLLLLALPMLASYAHDARMYAWAAFSVTGVFLYSVLFTQTGKTKDLVFLGLFTLIAVYTHYYCLIASFWANLTVFVRVAIKNKKYWKAHLIMSITVFVLYLPWLFNLLSQTSIAQKDFWVPKPSLQIILSCFTAPFYRKFFMELFSYPLVIIAYATTLITIYLSLIRKKYNNKMVLGFSLVIFYGTILTATVISVVSQPILFSRYIMSVVTMLMVPPALFFIHQKNIMIKWSLLIVFFICGIYTSVKSSMFSFGPYRQSLEYLCEVHPEVHKILHVTEVTTGPLLDHNETGNWQHFFLNNEKTLSYTNMKVFKDLHQISSLNEFLVPHEEFCVVNFQDFYLNKENFDQVLSECQTVAVDTITDNKSKDRFQLLLYVLKFQGSE